MKKFLAFTSLGLAACVAVAAGCAGNPRNFASLSSNWYTYPDNKKIQPAFTEGNENFRPEKISYAVTQSAPSDNGAYTVEYADGVYTTEFFAKKIFADELEKITAAEWREDYRSALGGADGENGKFLVLYCYKTELTIPKVTYKFGGEEKSFENEYRRTLSYFLSVEEYLSPVYSRQEVKSAAPSSASPEKPETLEECYEEYDRVSESFYTLSGSDVKTVISDNLTGAETTSGASGLSANRYSVFDCGYLDVVVRGMKGMSAGSGQTVSLYAPGTGVGNYYISGSAAALCENEEDSNIQLGKIKDVLSQNNVLSSEDTETLSTVAMNVVFDNGVFTGVSQRYWFANADAGRGKRTVMVKYSAPLAYNCGALEYLLSGIESLPAV